MTEETAVLPHCLNNCRYSYRPQYLIKNPRDSTKNLSISPGSLVNIYYKFSHQIHSTIL